MDSARSSPFADPVTFEQSSERVLMFQPSSMRLTVKEWYVSFAQDVHPSVVTLRCCPSSRLAILGEDPLYFLHALQDVASERDDDILFKV